MKLIILNHLTIILSPCRPTFYKVYKKKSTEGFQSVPYVVGLFSAMLWIYYALLKSNTLLLITINSAGCVFQTVYICIFLIYAPRKARVSSIITSLALISILALLITNQNHHADADLETPRLDERSRIRPHRYLNSVCCERSCKPCSDCRLDLPHLFSMRLCRPPLRRGKLNSPQLFK